MKTQIFAHLGFVGMSAGDKLVNDVTQPGQMGYIVNLDEIEISQEAFDILLKVPKSRDDIGEVMCWEAGEIKCFGWLGGCKKVLPKEADGDRDYNPELLRRCICQLEAPAEFKQLAEEWAKEAA